MSKPKFTEVLTVPVATEADYSEVIGKVLSLEQKVKFRANGYRRAVAEGAARLRFADYNEMLLAKMAV